MVHTISQIFQKTLNKFRYVNELLTFKKHYAGLCSSYPGSYYSPIIDKNEILERGNVLWPSELPTTIAGVELQVEQQVEWLTRLKAYIGEIDFKEQPTEGRRYFFENDFYSYSDALMLYTFIRALKPTKIVEVGSGFSSAAMLDSLDQLKLQETQVTFVEPNPERLLRLLKNADAHRYTIHQKKVQDLSPAIFSQLNPGDILFIDSSHVLKTGSDLQFLLFEILPILKQGVFIHFHDIFYPFEYPKEWVLSGINWNEIYMIRAFLMHNNAYTIEYFSHYMHCMHAQEFDELPLARKNFGGNLWLKKQ